ncbi:biotin transporter BioY [Microvirga tunisiensis]|uniref:Biotin transporter n=1 Tax=Microvirga tunisiensis TaxID=2108360 RepID=A0A5N7MMP4_9HYPH|nr:biotin transporter BioY [Microvirga tunisiensis]MPR10104.1 biotin transporter BioY [Microvirga tunisiensis]MPR28311.1 biotin transporter BioY [Microvirga tunisiensis]
MQNPHTAAAADAQPAFVPLRFDRKSRLFQGGAILLGSLFLAICSWISVPMVPVPVTMQTFGVLVLGAMCGWRLALSASLVYLAEGALGLPVFAGGAAGAHHLLGPTGGYLISFPVAAALVGYLAEKGWMAGLLRSVGVMLLGHGLILTLGTVYLATKIGMDHALAVGFAPFVLGSVLKAALAASIIEAARRRR